MTIPEQDILHSLVARVFRIDDVTAGDHDTHFLYRYRGQLVTDSIQAYDQLADALRPYNLTPLFRKDDEGHQVVFIANSLPSPRRSNINVNIVLFILTVFSVMFAGVEVPPSLASDGTAALLYTIRNIFTGWPFALSLLSILLAHEFGHYLTARLHKTSATLPYFIPFPTLLGTLGAVIVWKELPRNKRILFDVGVAGPLVGLVVAIPILLYGLSISQLKPIDAPPAGLMSFLEGNSILYLLAKFLVFGKLLPQPLSYGGLSPIIYWVRYFFTGYPVPMGGLDVTISSVALAGWAGILVTALNLLPVGQLDGGHIMYVLFGKRLRYAFPVVIVLMGILGLFWSGWWLWVFLLFIFGRQSAEPLDQITELDPRRRALAWFMIAVFILVFMPVPMVFFGQN
jgi:membrane-associated protease RseP (regulator of RpoE activity)